MLQNFLITLVLIWNLNQQAKLQKSLKFIAEVISYLNLTSDIVFCCFFFNQSHVHESLNILTPHSIDHLHENVKLYHSAYKKRIFLYYFLKKWSYVLIQNLN